MYTAHYYWIFVPNCTMSCPTKIKWMCWDSKKSCLCCVSVYSEHFESLEMQYLLFMWTVSTCMIVWLVARDSGSLMQWNMGKVRLGFTPVWLTFHVFWSVMVRRLFCSVWNAAVCEGMCKPQLGFVPYVWRILHLCNRVEEVLRTRVS